MVEILFTYRNFLAKGSLFANYRHACLNCSALRSYLQFLLFDNLTIVIVERFACFWLSLKGFVLLD